MTSSPSGERKGEGAGIAAALVTVVIWASWLLSTRYAVTGRFTLGELMILRFVPAAVLLAPFWLRGGIWPRGVRWHLLVMIVLGSGAGFVAIMGTAMRLAPVADAGALAPGTLPLAVAAASALVLGERFSRLRLAGFALIVAGGAVVAGGELLANAAAGAWRGHLLFLCGAALWAGYTVAFRLSGLAPMQSAALVAFWSSAALLPALPFADIAFAGADAADIAVMALEQGVIVGVLALWTYGSAVRSIGPSRTAAFAALVPVLALAGGAVLFGEPLTPFRIAGVAVVAAGVVLASGVRIGCVAGPG